MYHRPSIIAGAFALLLSWPAHAGGLVIDPFTTFPATGGGTPTIASVASANDTTSWTNMTVPKPTGTISADFILALIADGYGGQSSTFPTAPDGTWTNLQGGVRSFNSRLWTYSHVAGSSEPASWTFGGVSGGATAAGASLRITDGSTVEDSAIATGLGTPVGCPSVTTSGADRLIVTFTVAGNFEDDVTITPAGTLVDSGGAIQKGEWLIDQRNQASAGASGTISHTISGSNISSASWACVTVAVAP